MTIRSDYFFGRFFLWDLGQSLGVNYLEGVMMDIRKPRIEFVYCTQCRWMLRSAWMAQEILSSFEAEIGEVVLVPATGGIFRVVIDGVTVWNRKTDGGFPQITELKRIVRDVIAPDKPLGHSDRVGEQSE